MCKILCWCDNHGQIGCCDLLFSRDATGKWEWKKNRKFIVILSFPCVLHASSDGVVCKWLTTCPYVRSLANRLRAKWIALLFFYVFLLFFLSHSSWNWGENRIMNANGDKIYCLDRFACWLTGWSVGCLFRCLSSTKNRCWQLESGHRRMLANEGADWGPFCFSFIYLFMAVVVVVRRRRRRWWRRASRIGNYSNFKAQKWNIDKRRTHAHTVESSRAILDERQFPHEQLARRWFMRSLCPFVVIDIRTAIQCVYF